MDFWGVLFEWLICGALLSQKGDKHIFGSATKPASNLAGLFCRGREKIYIHHMCGTETALTNPASPRKSCSLLMKADS